MAGLKQNKIDIKAGVIEGFFGKPWSWAARLSGADFLRDGPMIAERILADIHLLQSNGLAQLDADTRSRLLIWYEKQQSNPFAGEVAAWLRGEYAFDPECLTT
jgi:hypothetical protein